MGSPEPRRALRASHKGRRQAGVAQMVKRARTGGGASYRVRWRYGGGREGAWQSVTFTDHASATTFRAHVESRGHRLRADAPEVRDRTIITGGRSVGSGAPTFGEVAERYIVSRAVKANTQEKYRGLIENNLAPWKDTPVDAIRRDDVADLMNSLIADGRS